MTKYDKAYANDKASDAYIAGHLADWLYFNKATKGQMLHIITVMNNELPCEGFDPFKMAKHLDLIFSEQNEAIANRLSEQYNK